MMLRAILALVRQEACHIILCAVMDSAVMDFIMCMRPGRPLCICESCWLWFFLSLIDVVIVLVVVIVESAVVIVFISGGENLLLMCCGSCGQTCMS